MPDFLHRLDPDPEQVRLLIKAGCFDALEGVERRPQLLWMINAWAKARPRGQKGFFLPECKAPPGLRKLTSSELLRQEEEGFGFLISLHPLTLYRGLYSNLEVTPASEFKNKIGQRIMAAGWCVTGKYAETSKGELMEFVSFEDESDIYETVFFPDAYRRYCHILHMDLPYLLYGRVSDDLGATSLKINRIKLLAKSTAAAAPEELSAGLPSAQRTIDGNSRYSATNGILIS